MVELRDLLLGLEFRQLDAGLGDGWHWLELVASHPNHLPLAIHQLHRHVLQLALRKRLPHRISRGWS